MSYFECSLVKVNCVSGLPQPAMLCHQWTGWMSGCQTAVYTGVNNNITFIYMEINVKLISNNNVKCYLNIFWHIWLIEKVFLCRY